MNRVVTRTPRQLDGRSNLVPPFPPQADPLADALECLGLRCWIPGRFELTAPWGLQVPARPGWFYLVVQNTCLLAVAGQPLPVPASGGDLIVVFPGHAHCLRDRASSPAVPLQMLWEQRHFDRCEPLVHGGGGPPTQLLCGCFLLDGLERSPLRAALPPFLCAKADRQDALPYVAHIARLLELETAARGPCSQLIINRLVRILIIKGLQAHVSAPPAGGASWLRALADPDIGAVLGLMHAQPDVRWTVAALAEQAAMSRSRFASRFAELVGQPPLEYLTRWRIHKACLLLRTSRATLKEVAAQVGYESASAFSKAFTLRVGASPGAYRSAGAAAGRPPSVNALPC